MGLVQGLELTDLSAVCATELLAFSCGNDELDHWLHDQSAKDCSCGLCRAYACWLDGSLAGFFSLSPCELSPVDVSNSMCGGIHRLPIPAYIVGRLGTSVGMQGRGVGTTMLLHAMRLACEASSVAGGRLLYIEAKSHAVANWYAHNGFTPFPGEPLRLVMKLSKARRISGQAFSEA
ncbi:MAG: hypothetical protein SPD98_07865 [Tractidigestivibacter sp.]|uniref:hypothetical protein n=1 Tax=Tractidigestivibacter sp. TaxID=2847320 RepID=UPI002A82BB5B|nr:hypothetical protein [Tractidigestivibacter sp.]MDY4535147.1 hypothetical protein [Tractidigestivibacter sp.]